MQSYSDLNNLEEISFIGGTEYTLEFTVYDEDSVAIDISTATIVWNMSYYGQQDVNVITYNLSGGITITDISEFEVVLDGSDTINLSGKFVHQAVITDFDGTPFVPGQGIITILPRISST